MMKKYTKPLVEVYELRVTENIAASAAAKAKWDAAKKVMTTQYDLLAGGGSYSA